MEESAERQSASRKVAPTAERMYFFMSSIDSSALRLGLDVQLRVIRRVELLEFIEPLFAGLIRSEAPVLAMIIPIVRIERLGFLPVFRGEFVVALVVEINGELEKLASASISADERGLTRRANSSSERTNLLASPLATQSRRAVRYAVPSVTMLFPPTFSLESVVQAGSAGRTTRPFSSTQMPMGTLLN